MKKWLVVLVFSMVMVSVGCHRKTVVTNLPPGVSSTVVMNWYTAVGVSNTLASTSNQLVNSLISLNRQGLFPDGPAYSSTLTAIGKIARAGQQADAKLRAAPETFAQPQKDILLELSREVAMELQTAQAQTTLGIKNPDSQKAVSSLLMTISNALSLAQALSK